MTPFQRYALLFCLGFFLAFSCAISFFLGRKTAPKCPPIPPADTVYVADTSHHEEPEPAETIPAGFELIRVGTVAQLKQTIAALEAAAAAAAAVHTPRRSGPSRHHHSSSSEITSSPSNSPPRYASMMSAGAGVNFGAQPPRFSANTSRRVSPNPGRTIRMPSTVTR